MSVASLTTDAKAYAQSVLDGADAALDAATISVQTVGYTGLSFAGVPLPQAPTLPDQLTPPTLDDIALDLPAEPADTLLFQDISPLEAGTAPVFSVTAPTLTLPDKPAALAAFAGEMPAINTSLVFPEPPDALLNPLVDAPVLSEHATPVKPQVLLPAFTASAPTDLPAAPTNIEQTVANAYASQAPSTIAMLDGYVDAMLTKFNPNYHSAMAAIETQLATYLAGGTGLDPDAENAIYERSRDKVDAETRRVGPAAYADTADKGFTLPNGALLAAMGAARQAGADNNARSAREIVVMAAEMEQKNLQFAVTTSAGLRTALLSAALSYHQNLIQINGQALDYAKTILAAIIEAYNTSVKAFSLKLDIYKTEAQVYEVRLKAAMAAIDLYLAEIKALEALVSVDRAKVEIYKARVDVLMVYANVYRAQIEAVQGRANLEKLKIDLFQAQVQGFTAGVQAKNAEWQGYSAAIGGEEAKARMFGVQVQGYLGQVQGYKATVEAKSEIVKATATTNQARATQYKATMDGYSTVVQARGEVARTRLENQRQKVIAFQVQAQAQIANFQVRAEFYRTTGEIAIKNAALSIEAIVKSAEIQRAYGNSLASLATANATVHGQLASAAMSGMNTLAAETLAT